MYVARNICHQELRLDLRRMTDDEITARIVVLKLRGVEDPVSQGFWAHYWIPGDENLCGGEDKSIYPYPHCVDCAKILEAMPWLQPPKPEISSMKFTAKAVVSNEVWEDSHPST